MLYTRVPEVFRCRFEIVGSFCEYKGKFLLLHRHGEKPQGNTWGLPAGKIEEGETPEEAALREILEETGYPRVSKEHLFLLEKFYVKYEMYDFVYYQFSYKLPEEIAVVLNPQEHMRFVWVTPEESLKMPLIQDLDTCVERFYLKKG